ncbi:MAG: HAMP domain-containing histidine kinase [Bacteroidia bacterium]|nr:HAMP domain-containing histidine kinase [Bacteroidia bacterium]MDW8235230.1 HAMP domain-containing sensor histidine kinase [Bacteroidia bacterium]
MRLRWIVLWLVAPLGVIIFTTYYTRQLTRQLLNQQTFMLRFYAHMLDYAAHAPEPCLNNYLLEFLYPSDNQKFRAFLVPLVITDAGGTILRHNLNEVLNELSQPASFTLDQALLYLDIDTTEFPPISVQIAPGKIHKIYYGEPLILEQVQRLPLFSGLAVVGIAIMGISFLAAASKSRQQRLWLGLAKETAHQLGTPLSGLVGSVEVLKGSPETLPRLLPRMEIDIQRLQEVADRFSRIGMRPQLKSHRLFEVLEEVVRYMKHRLPSSITLELKLPAEPSPVLPLDATLLRWTIENLIRNSVDALPPEGGTIFVRALTRRKGVIVEIEDNGRGIPTARWEDIFRPGYSTKKHGWGMGLALARRVIEEYHGGEIFVRQSKPLQGTVFRIWLPRERPFIPLRRWLRPLRYRLNLLLSLLRKQ